MPKAQRNQRIEYFAPFNNFSSKQKLQQDFKSWSNFSLTNPCNNLEKSNYKFWQNHVTTLTMQQGQWLTEGRTRQGNDRPWVNITMKSGVTADLIFNCKFCCAAWVIEVKCISWHLLHLEKRICIYTVSHSMWNLPFISNNNYLKKKFPIIADQDQKIFCFLEYLPL